jgi:hypothetical protein
MISVPFSYLDVLLDTQSRVSLLKELYSRYGVDGVPKAEIALVLGFDPPQPQEVKNEG